MKPNYPKLTDLPTLISCLLFELSHKPNLFMIYLQGQVSEFSQMNDKLSEQVRLLLEEEVVDDKDLHGPYRLARNAYRSCMDQQRIESLGVTPLGTWSK